jgi:CheY-like chemotaxis protein
MKESPVAKIRMIDDDLELAENTAIFLREAGHDVRVWEETDGAVEDLLKDRPDLIVLDVMFPGNASGGFDLARAIKKDKVLRPIPIIMLTGVNEAFGLPEGFSEKDADPDWMPVQHFIDKPVDPKVLITKIDELLKVSEK